MTTKIDHGVENEHLSYEAGGWVACRVPRPEMDPDATDLLARSAVSRPGNLRFAIVDCQVLMLGEVRFPEGLLSLGEARERLREPVCDPAQEISVEEVASLLDETGHGWSQAEDGANRWNAVVAGASGHRCELTAAITDGGVEVSGRMGSWDGELSEASREAIARFLATSQGRIRFARYTLREREATAVSFAGADRLDVELPDSLAAVTAACRNGWREVRALADEAVAAAYLEVTP